MVVYLKKRKKKEKEDIIVKEYFVKLNTYYLMI